MMMKHACITLSVLAVSAASPASVVEFTNKAEWEAAVGSFTTIDFVLPPALTPIADHYADYGVIFGDSAFSHQTGSYVNDGWGLFGIQGAWAYFDTPQSWIAVDFPGSVYISLYLDGDFLYQSPLFGPSGTGNFAGLISEVAFDAIFLDRPPGPSGPTNVFIDDLHFGTIIPGSGALGLLGFAALLPRRRRQPL